MPTFGFHALVKVTSQDYQIGAADGELILGSLSHPSRQGIAYAHLFNGLGVSIQPDSDLTTCVVIVDVHSCGLRGSVNAVRIRDVIALMRFC